MEFKKFENKTDYLEYLQIYIFQRVSQGKILIDLEEYLTFELTDTLIASFNKWVENSEYVNSQVTHWLESNPNKILYFRENFPAKFKPKVSIWSDREKSPYFKEKLQESFAFENFIARLISSKYGLDLGQYLTREGQYKLGENALGIEIKNDTLIQKYGNIYIEYQEKSSENNHSYVDSGILKTDNCVYFLIGTASKFYIFKKEVLVGIYNEELSNLKKGKKSDRGIVFKQIATSKGYVYPVKHATKNEISLDAMISEIKARLNI